MKSQIVIGSLALVLPTLAAIAQEENPTAASPAAAVVAATPAAVTAAQTVAPSASSAFNNGLYAYADYSHYIGAGAPKELVDDEITSMQDYYVYMIDYFINFLETYGYDASGGVTLHGRTPSGNLPSATLGYARTFQNGDVWSIQASYRNGTVKTGILDYYISVYEDGDSATSIGGSMKYSEDIEEYHLTVSYSPKRFSYLSFGLEYSHSDYDGEFNTTYHSGDSYSYQYDYGFSSTADDIVAHVSLNVPPIVVTKAVEGLFFTPTADLGVGYSFRDGSVSYAYYFENDDPEHMLGSDTCVIEAKVAFGWTYQIKANQKASLDVGGFYRADMNGGLSTELKGYFVRAGYSYNW